MTAPLIVAGMHRSGTSLAASYVSALGVDMGESIGPNSTNSAGFVEDAGFLRLNRRMLAGATRDSRGHGDWGWTESQRLDRSGLGAFAAEAQELIESRDNGGLWGWKDPRTTLLLDFWEDAVKAASGTRPQYLFLYRYPWDVADSMQRLGAEVFLNQPEYAYQIWEFYNRHLLEFVRAHRGRAVLASMNAAVADPDRFEALLQSRLELDTKDSPFETVLDRKLFSALGRQDPLPGLVTATSPSCIDLLGELDSVADLPASDRWKASPLVPGVRRADHGPRPDLSVVLPCYNHGQFLIEAVASVERAAPVATELVIVDDGSTQPRTLEVLAILRRAGYQVIEQEHAGLSAARNRGIEASRGRYLLPLDADNRVRAGFTQAAVDVLERKPDVGVVYGDRIEFGARSGRVEQRDFDLPVLLRANYIDSCAVVRRRVWEEIGGYDERLRAWEDWDFWLGAAERGWAFERLDQPAFDYRVRPRSLTALMDVRQTHENGVHLIVSKHATLYRRHLTTIFPALQWGFIERAKRVEEIDAVCLAQADRIENLEEDLGERLEWARQLQGELTERLAWARQLETDGQAKDRRAEELEAELATIRPGRLFRLGSIWWRSRDRFLLEGTRTQRVYHWLVSHLTGKA